MTQLVLGTRGSDLALVQCRDAAGKLAAAHPSVEIIERVIKTTGDQRLDISLSSPGALDKGLFTKELEEALLRRDIDAAVHSLKDLPTDLPQGLVIGAILERANPADCLASKTPGGLAALREGAVVATSSLRRSRQLQWLRPDLCITPIRGNVPTRLRKLVEDSDTDALVLAQAAVDRLGRECVPEGLHLSVLDAFLPAPGQGAVAIECRAGDDAVLTALAAVHHEQTAMCVEAERRLLNNLGGGCHMPLGVRSLVRGGEVILDAAIFHEDRCEWICGGPGT